MAQWIAAARTSDLPADGVLGVKLAGREIALFRLGDQYFATSDWCTHAFALLSRGTLDGGTIECPIHGGRFDIRSGWPVDGPVTKKLRCFPVKVEVETILVELD